MSWTDVFHDANFHVVLVYDKFFAQVKSYQDRHLRPSTDTLGTLPIYHETRRIVELARIQRGEGRGPDPLPLENHKTIGFLSNTG